MRRLSDEGRKNPRAIAVASIMPPDESGIATFTHSVFSRASYGVDIFTHYKSIESYLSGVHDERLKNTNVRVFSRDCLPFARAIVSYDAELYVLGNSAHHLPLISSLRSLAHFRTRNPTFVYIHDPFLFNIFKLFCKSQGFDFTAFLALQYPECAEFLLTKNYDGDNHDLARRSIFALRPILHDIPLDGAIVNSASAKAFVEKDLPHLAGNRVFQLFHPVFPCPSAEYVAEPRAFRIGTFGVPGQAKCTEMVIDAFRELRREFPDVELVIAGFDVGQYSVRCGVWREKGIIIEESPSDERLIALMKSCHVAVQLRQFNLGESSGCVPQLLAADVPVIVSDIGSFSEYGKAVRAIPADAAVHDLLEAIKGEAFNQGRRRLARAAYVRDHTPEKFCDSLMDLISNGATSSVAAACI